MIYDFKCRSCGYEKKDYLTHRFILWEEALVCPKCGKQDFKRVVPVRHSIKINFKENRKQK